MVKNNIVRKPAHPNMEILSMPENIIIFRFITGEKCTDTAYT